LSVVRWSIFLILVVATLVAALIAARYCWRASLVAIDEPAASIDDNPAAHHYAAVAAIGEASMLHARMRAMDGRCRES
jgi:hypothetical protein